MGRLGAILGRIGAVLDRLGAILGHLEALLDSPEAQEAEFVDFPYVLLGFFGPRRRLATLGRRMWRSSGGGVRGGDIIM